MKPVDLFKTTHKGIVTMAELGDTTLLSRNYYGMSLTVQFIFLFFFLGVFGLAIYKSVKKIKNPRFVTQKEQEESEQEENLDEQINGKQTNGNLIYRFDEEEQKEKKAETDDDNDQKNSVVESSSDDQYDREHDEYEEKYLMLDHNLLFFGPFLIAPVICNNSFTLDILSVLLLLSSMVFFFVFNIKGFLGKKWLTILFFIPAIFGFLPVFYRSHSMNP